MANSIGTVPLAWGIKQQYRLPGYIVTSIDEEETCEVNKTTDENGSNVDYTFFNYIKTLKVAVFVKDTTILPHPGETMLVNEVPYLVMPPVSLSRSNSDKVKATISLERSLDNNIPAA